MKCLLIGNFGVGNLGDEALKDYFLTTFDLVDWTVVSARPQERNEVPRLPGGLRSLFSLRWLRTLSAYRSCDAVVFGGGSLFTDTESAYACFLWWLHAKLAFFLRKDVHLAFQGIGPFRTRSGRWFSRAVCRQAASISVRDEASQKRVGDLCVNKKCILSFDPVFSLINNKKIDSSSHNLLVLIPRKNSSDKFVKTARESYESRPWGAVRILSMQPDEKSEQVFCNKLEQSVGASSSVVPIRTLDRLLSELSGAALVISERYHGALAAMALDKEVRIVTQSAGDKLSSLLNKKNVNSKQVEIGESSLRQALKIV